MKKNITIFLITILSLFSFQQSYANIARGQVGTCIWYITDEGELVIAPMEGSMSGDLPEEGWTYQYDNDGNLFYTTPWYGYREEILSAKILPGVNATSCSCMFTGLDKVVSIDLSGLNTENVTNMSHMFFGCSALTSLDLSNFNTQKMEYMSDMFSGCSALTSLDLSSFNTQNVTDMGAMFYGCSSLTSLDLSNFNTQNVTSMFGMFYDCSSLTSLDLSNFNTENVTSMGGMFDRCSSLATIISNREVPSTLKVGTFSETFDNRANCTLLVPVGSKELYAAADGWNELGKISDGSFEFPEDAIAQGEAGTCVWYITSEGELVIAPADGVSGDLPEEGWTYQYDNDGNLFYTTPWYGYREEILSAKILPGVNATSCSYMFAVLDNVVSIDLSGLNTQNLANMGNMFIFCSTLTSLDLSNFNTQNVTDMSYMFSSCSSLTSLDLSNFNTQNVTSMGCMFDSCSSLTSLDLSNFNTQSVTRMDSMFAGCSSLTSLDLSNFNTQNVTSMGGMFYGCSSLTSLDLSNFNTQNVTSMGSMFFDCISLTSLDLSNFNTQNVTGMSGMFWNCSSLTSLDLSNFNTQNVEYTNNMFNDCPALATIISNREVPSTLKVGTFRTLDNRANCTLLVPIGTKTLYAAADGWNELGIIEDILVVIPADAIAQGEVGTCVWYITSEGELVIAPADGVSGDLPEEGWEGTFTIFNEYTTTAPWGGLYTSSIYSAKIMPGVNAKSCSAMFGGLSKMKTIDLSNFDTRNVTNMVSMFEGCTSLESLDISNFNTENVRFMNNMFHSCSSLTSLDLSHFNTSKVEDMSHMFAYCRSLTSLDLTSFDTQNVTSMFWMFAYCYNLASVNLSSFNTQSVRTMVQMFNACQSLTSLNLNNFNTQYVVNMESMFSGCAALAYLDISNFNTEKVTDMANMFSGCAALNSLDLSSFNTEKVTNMNYIFSGCSALTSLDLSNFNTQNVTSMIGMFYECNALTSLNMSKFNTEKVQDMSIMFYSCSALTTITSNDETPSPLKAGTFDSFENRENCTLLVPIGTKALYAVADGWNELGIIEDNLVVIPADAIAQGEVGTCVWYITSEGELVIAPADGESGDLPYNGWTSINAAPWHEYKDDILSAKVMPGVNAGSCGNMFYELNKMVSVDLSGLNTENTTYMSYMFFNCSALTSVNLSNIDTQKVTGMTSMFYGCSALTSLDLSNFNTQSVKDMPGMFKGCSTLTSLDLSSFDTQNVINMGSMFYGCSALKTLNLGNLNTQNVTDMSYMFRDCSVLTSLDLSSFDTQNVTDMKYMFYGCSALTSLDLCSFDIQNVTDMSYMCNGCTSLAYLNLSGFNMENVTKTNRMFYSCPAISTIISDRETPSPLQVGTFESLDNRANCTLLVPEGTEALYATADGWNELGQIKVINEYFFGDLVASVSQEENIATDALAQLQLTFPDAVVGKPGFENCIMSDINMEMALTLMDSMSEIIEESYALTIDSIGTVEFTTNLKRGERYTVEVPRGLYIIYNNDKEYFSPAATLTYTTDYILGDVNDDKQHSVTDVVGVVSYIMKGSEQVGKLVVDCNIDEMVNIADASFLVEKIITGEFPTVAPAKGRLAAAKVPQLQLMETGDALALSFDGSKDYCSMQFDVTLKDDYGNDITSTDNLRITSAGGLNGHSITTGMVDGKLRVLIYSIENSAFSGGDILTVETETVNDYMVSITDAVIVTTGFASVYPDDVDKDVSMADGIKDLSADDGTTDIYDITGRKLNEVPKKGIFIIGGKKVIK